MKKLLFTVGNCMLVAGIYAQTVTQKLQSAYQKFAGDPQLKYAISSLYVIDAQTGQVVFDKNSSVGLAPASTQKVITSVTAFEILGKDYRYQTSFGIDKKNEGVLAVFPSGDPTFGSWRWPFTAGDSITVNLRPFIKREIQKIVFDNTGWDDENIPDGWIWQDIGNYYGAGAAKFNYRENQYDIFLKSGKSIGDSVSVTSVHPSEFSFLQPGIESMLTAAPKGSGDNAYVYLPSSTHPGYKIRGTIPAGENNFSISASITQPAEAFTNLARARLQPERKEGFEWQQVAVTPSDINIVFTHYSPTIDSIIYWFNKKSVNLYGEALIKTMGYEKKGKGTTAEGVKVLKDFWKQNGMDEDELNVVDGSGLSPLNRVTTHAQVQILKYAKNKNWFPYFLISLPEYNNMSMKSGTIRGVKGFTGYHKARNGREYIFSFLVNNYNGSPSALVSKMYRVLDVLK